MKKTAAQHAADILRETDNPSISAHDTGLVHMVAERIGIESDSYRTSKPVIAAIDRTNRGELLRGYCIEGRLTRRFWLPERAPDWLDKGEEVVMGGGGPVE